MKNKITNLLFAVAIIFIASFLIPSINATPVKSSPVKALTAEPSLVVSAADLDLLIEQVQRYVYIAQLYQVLIWENAKYWKGREDAYANTLDYLKILRASAFYVTYNATTNEREEKKLRGLQQDK